MQGRMGRSFGAGRAHLTFRLSSCYVPEMSQLLFEFAKTAVNRHEDTRKQSRLELGLTAEETTTLHSWRDKQLNRWNIPLGLIQFEPNSRFAGNIRSIWAKKISKPNLPVFGEGLLVITLKAKASEQFRTLLSTEIAHFLATELKESRPLVELIPDQKHRFHLCIWTWCITPLEFGSLLTTDSIRPNINTDLPRKDIPCYPLVRESIGRRRS